MNLCSLSLFSSISVMSNSLRPGGLQHARPLCPLPSPGACPNSCPSSQWWHPTILSSVVPFSFCLHSFPASGSLLMSQFFASAGQVLEVQLQYSNEYSGLISFRIDWLDLLAEQGDPQESSPTPQFKSINSSVLSFLYGPTLIFIRDYWKSHSFD